MEVPDRVRKERYFDPDFYELEVEQLWPRVWQMACRLEEIPEPRDFVEYEFLDQSVVVVRTDDMAACARSRTRAVIVACGSSRAAGTCASGFMCPFHGWCYGVDGKNTFVPRRKSFAEHNLRARRHRPRPRAVRGVGRLRVDQPRRRRPAAAAVHRARRHHPRRVAGRVAAHRVVVRVPPPRELEARGRGVRRGSTTSCRRTRSSCIPTRYGPRDGDTFDPRAYVDADIHYLRTMSEGMAGMVHANDVRIAEGLRDIELPADPALATATWNRTLNDAVVALAPRPRAPTCPTSTTSTAQGLNQPMFFHCFPHYFVLPMYSSASSYRFRPLGSGGDADGDLVAHAVPRGRASRHGRRRPSCGSATIRAGRRSPPRTSRTCRASNAACTRKGFEYMRLSGAASRATSPTSSAPIDGFLAGLPHDKLLPALQRSTCTRSTARSSTWASDVH